MDPLVMEATFEGVSPEELYAYWVEPERLTRWWPQEAETDPRPSGRYHLAWPAMGWHLRGVYHTTDPGWALAFDWAWDHQPELPTRQVAVRFEPVGDGTRLTLTHGAYGEGPAEREDRQSHLDGWTHFLSQLRLRQIHSRTGFPACPRIGPLKDRLESLSYLNR